MNTILSPTGLLMMASLLLINSSSLSQNQPFRLFLIGDAGENAQTGKTLIALQKKLESDSNSAVVFLGDNSYKNLLLGLVHKGLKGYDNGKITKKKILSQLSILKNYKGYVYFVPGNHDWWNRINISRGKKALLKEELFIEKYLTDNTSCMNRNEETFLPAGGDPGPASKVFNNQKLRIVFIDTQRLILAEMRSDSSEKEILRQFYFRLDSTLTVGANNNEKIVVVAHHPVLAQGAHSDTLKVKKFTPPKGKHFNPLKNIKYRIAASSLGFPPYHRMAHKIDSLLKKNNQTGIIYATGHEHSLEYFFKDGVRYLVSGAGSKIDSLDKDDHLDKSKDYCLWNQEGFFEVDFFKDQEKIILYHRTPGEDKPGDECLLGCPEKAE